MPERFTKTVDIKTVDEDARTATGAVLVPDELDHQHDFLRAGAVERFHTDDPETGVMHSAFPDDAAELERNELLDAPEQIGDETFPKGTWVATRRYEDDGLWQLVEDGVLQGFSIGGEIQRAAEHDTLPGDVRVPGDVDHEEGGTELINGVVDEVSDVDIPAVPRARYKSDLGKAILDEVEGEAEFVELMTEQRGHEESEARRLYQYLTDVREASKADDSVGKPFQSPQGAEFEDFEDCVETLTDGELEREEAEAVCGAWQEESKNKVGVNSTGQEVRDAMDEENMTGKNLDDPEFSEGDAVEWSSNDTTVRGRVADIGDEFTVGGGDVTITGDEGEAVYLIHELDDSLEPPQYRRENVAKPESSLDESQAELPPATDENFEDNMTATDTDGIDDATKLQVIKSWLTGSDDSETSGEAPGAMKATDDDEDDEGEDDDGEMTADNDKNADMTDNNQSDPPEWARSLTDTVEQIDDRVSKLEGDGDDEDAEKTMADAPEWAQDLAEKVDDLDERVDTISKQSGHSQQLDATEKDATDDGGDRVEQFKKGLVGAGGD